MGWFWNRNPPPKPPSDYNDPLRDLDPSLREFLEKESPVKYTPTEPPPPSSTTTTATSTSDPHSTTTQEPPPGPLIPKESLFPDGRYAHLWTSYRPQAELEAEAKSEQEKLADVLEGYKQRKASIGRIAIQNCAFEQAAVEDCYEHGSYARRLLLCRPESRAFDRCYMTQARFLKALGYMSTYERPPEMDEEIQMHADTLYHRMLDQERQIEAAKAAGEPVPTFPPILAPKTDKRPRGFRDATVLAAMEGADGFEIAARDPTVERTPAELNLAAVAAAKKSKEDRDLPQLHPDVERRLKPAAALGLRRRMKDMDPLERELEERATITEIEDAAMTGQQIEDLRDEGRRKKREAGQGRGELGDWIVKVFGGGPGAK